MLRKNTRMVLSEDEEEEEEVCVNFKQPLKRVREDTVDESENLSNSPAAKSPRRHGAPAGEEQNQGTPGHVRKLAGTLRIPTGLAGAKPTALCGDGDDTVVLPAAALLAPP